MANFARKFHNSINRKKMTNKTCVILLAGTLMLGSCGEKNGKERAVEPVNVKTMMVQQETADGQ